MKTYVTTGDTPSDDNVLHNIPDQSSEVSFVNVECLETLEKPHEQLAKFPEINFRKIISHHLNINSLRNKFVEMHRILQRSLTEIFFVSETN